MIPSGTAQGALPRFVPDKTTQVLPNAHKTNGAMIPKKLENPPIGRAQVLKASEILERYKKGKANLEKKIIENENWYRMRHWESIRKGEAQEIEPASAWLFNNIANKHADAMDNFPSPNILPREEGDKPEAEKLSSIVPVILEQNEFEETYSDVWYRKLIAGTGVYGVFWDKHKLNGLGDISINRVDILNLFWEPGIQDIQNSKNIFHVELRDNEELEAIYPELSGKLSSPSLTLSQYVYDDEVDTSNKSAVVDWYYKKNQNGRTVLHFCKYVGDTILFSTENSENFANKGLYDHGRYPFEFDVLYPIMGCPAGFGFIDVGKGAQGFIDKGNQAIGKNMAVNASPRYFMREDGGINEEEFSDLSKDIVHCSGNLGEDSLRQIPPYPLNDIYVTILNNKIDELKETTGNRDISNGGTSSGVTAASAIAAMQEAGSKLSRDMNKGAYRAFRNICKLIIELIRQFYDFNRCFRIIGEKGAAKFIEFSGKDIAPRKQTPVAGQEMGFSLPVFDVEVTAQKASPYSKMAQNELALQFFKAGFFNPQISDQALACVEMMDFDRKNFVLERISQNGTMFQQIEAMKQQMLSLAQIVDSYKGNGPVISSQIASQFGMEGPQIPMRSDGISESEAFGASAEHGNVKKARQRVAESTSPT